MASSSDKPSRQPIPWLRIGAEGVAIVVSILLAFGIQAWWEARADRVLELHLLQGFEVELSRDTSDIRFAMNAARGRAAGADELLRLIGDPIAGRMSETPPGAAYAGPEGPGTGNLADWLLDARAHFPPGSVGMQKALHMVLSPGSIQTIGLSTATFGEATASGQLDVIRDELLRSLITNYYFTAGQLGPADARAERHWEELVGVAAEAGISVTGDATDDSVLAALGSDRLVAELKNARDMATFQLLAGARVLASAEEVLEEIEAAIGEME